MIFWLIGILVIYGIVDFFFHLRNNIAEKERFLRQKQLDKQMEIKRIWEEKQTLEKIKREKYGEARRIRAIKPLLKPRMNLIHTGYEELGIVTILAVGKETITCGTKNGLMRFPVSALGKHLNITRDQSLHNEISFDEIPNSEMLVESENILTTSTN